MNIYDRLQAVEDREELGELLSDPGSRVSYTKRFMELSRRSKYCETVTKPMNTSKSSNGQ